MIALTLFAGLGGADVGLRDAGIEHARCIEWDPRAAAVLAAAGFPTWVGDVRDPAAYTGLPPIDLLWASPPCQDWSSAGKRAGAGGARNGWPWTFDALDRVRPAWFVAENVPGALMHRGAVCGPGGRDCPRDPAVCPASYFDLVVMAETRRRFAWADYSVLNAAGFGAPQHRKRVFVVAGPHPIAWPRPTHSGEALAVAKWVSGDYWRNVGIDPVGEPSAQEAAWVAEWRGSLFRRPEFARLPWRTVRQALGLSSLMERSNGVRGLCPTTTDAHSPPVLASSGGSDRLQARVTACTTNPRGAGREHERVVREITDEPAPTVAAAQIGNRRPWIGSGLRGSEWGADSPSPTVRDGNGTADLYLRTEQITAVAATVDAPAATVPSAGDQYLHDSDPGTRRSREPERLDRPSPTVTTTEEKGSREHHMRGGPDRASDALWLATGRRRLTPRECAILQGLPADHPIEAAGTKSAMYTAIGNAVVPAVAEAIARAILTTPPTPESP